MPKLFISIPMRGIDPEDIKEEINTIKAFIEDISEQEYELIDTVFTDEPPTDNKNGCWYLGKSISLLADADLCVFHPDWKTAPGCLVEHAVCALYDIPYIEIHDKDFEDAYEDEEE